MEKVGSTNSNSGGLDKKKTESSDVVSLMMKQQQQQQQGNNNNNNNNSRNYMMRSDLDRPFVGGGGGGGHVGPINCSSSSSTNSGGANEALGNIYPRDYYVTSSSSFVPKFVANSNSTTTTTHLQQQPFHFISNPSVYSFKSPGGMSMNNVGYPFTSAQWEELERQALIYKCMISSVPVPPDLLFPLTRSFTAPIASSLCNTRYSKNGDPEPGRCKRTDGKKWRCSRDVAPNQKYCERHLHRGRPRSRKPVEVLKNINGESHKKTRLEQTTTTTNTLPNSTTVSQQQFVHQTTTETPLLLFNANTDLSVSAAATSYKGTNRDMSLIVENEMVAMDWAEHQWKNLMEAKMGMANEGCSSSIYGSSAHSFNQDYGNFFAYSAFPSPEIEAPTGFINAWSVDNLNKGNLELSLSPNLGNLSPSLNLSMAMAAGHVLDEEMSNIQVVNDEKDCVGHKPNELRWLSPVSWEPFTLGGGPLAEALHPGSITVSTPASPYDSMNSNQATTASSPSGVLHRTLFSNSDGSVCNSPTLAAPPSEIAFQWLS